MGNNINTRKFLGRKIFGIAPPTITAYDSDFQLVIDAIQSTGVTLTTNEKNAGNTLVVSCKSSGVWANSVGFYGILGGTSGAHKWNWKNPVDLNTAFRIGFTTGWTHSSTGAKPNGVSAYGNLYMAPSTNLQLSNTFLAFYSRTNSALFRYDLGVTNGLATGNPTLGLICRDNVNNMRSWVNRKDANVLSTANTDGRGFFIANINNTTTQTNYRNGIVLGSNVASNFAVATYGLVLSAQNNTNTIANYSDKENAFFAYGNGLTGSQITSFNSDILAYETALGRQV